MRIPLRIFGRRSLPSSSHLPRIPSYPLRNSIYLGTRNMANLAAERFLADRSAPLCSLDVSKTFGQLTCVAIV